MNQDNLIFSYTRAEAIKDGLQVCVSDLFPNDTEIYKYPVYFTSEVWELCQSQGAIVWDICCALFAHRHCFAMANRSTRLLLLHQKLNQMTAHLSSIL